MNSRDREEALTLEILQAIDGSSDVTQRGLADRLGVALGLANSYLRRCVKKGLVKIKQAPANRYAYYLTPKGFAEKGRLTAEYLTYSFGFYRSASDSIAAAFDQCRTLHGSKLVLCGVSDLAEIASVRARDHDVELLGTYDPATNNVVFVGLPVWSHWEDVPKQNACLLTALIEPARLYREMTDRVGADKVIVPMLLQPAVGAARIDKKKS